MMEHLRYSLNAWEKYFFHKNIVTDMPHCFWRSIFLHLPERVPTKPWIFIMLLIFLSRLLFFCPLCHLFFCVPLSFFLSRFELFLSSRACKWRWHGSVEHFLWWRRLLKRRWRHALPCHIVVQPHCVTCLPTRPPKQHHCLLAVLTHRSSDGGVATILLFSKWQHPDHLIFQFPSRTEQ